MDAKSLLSKAFKTWKTWIRIGFSGSDIAHNNPNILKTESQKSRLQLVKSKENVNTYL
jgi:hypothetical protein